RPARGASAPSRSRAWLGGPPPPTQSCDAMPTPLFTVAVERERTSWRRRQCGSARRQHSITFLPEQGRRPHRPPPARVLPVILLGAPPGLAPPAARAPLHPDRAPLAHRSGH